MHKFFKDIFTGRDGRTYDVARVLWVLSFMMFAGLTFYAIYKGNYVFDPLLWSSGIAAMAGGYGASIYAKAGTEPQPSELVVQHGDIVMKQRFGKMAADDSSDPTPTVPSVAAPATSDSDDDATATASVTTVTATSAK